MAKTWHWRAAVGLAAALPLACAHAVRPSSRPFPTLDVYSEGTSRLAGRFASAFKMKDRSVLEQILAADLALRPAETASGVSFVSPSGMRVERYTTGGAPLAGPPATAHLAARRDAFQGLVRSEARITGIEGKGDARTLAVHSFFAGIAPDGSRLQEEAWWRWDVRARSSPAPASSDAPTAAQTAGAPPASPGAREWTIVAMTEEKRTRVVAPKPLLQQVYPTGNPGDWVADSDRDAAFENTAVPGEHDTGGVALLDDCVDGGSCVLFGSGAPLGALTRGRDEGPFSNQAVLLGLDGSHGEAKSLLAADFTNDAIPDLFITYDKARCRLYRGKRLLEEATAQRGRIEHLFFEEVTDAAGLGGLEGPYRSAAAFDADRDGRLDLYIVGFGDYGASGPNEAGDNGASNRFFRNVSDPAGGLKFEDQTIPSGTGDTGWGMSASASDYDGDGRIDLYVTNAFGAGVLYRNVTEQGGPIHFENASKRTHTDVRGSAAGCAWGDYDDDGDLDLFVGHYSADESWILSHPNLPASSTVKRVLRGRLRGGALLRNESQRGEFVEVAADAGVSDTGWPWGAAWADIDGDGRLDLVVANGMLYGDRGQNREVDYWNELAAGWDEFSKGTARIAFGADGVTGPQPERLFLNLGDGTFAEVAYAAGLVTMADLRGLIASDINGDGAPEIVGGAFLGAPVIFENMNPGGSLHILVRLEGTASNRDAVGAIVKLTAGGRTQTRQVTAGSSFLSDGGRALDFSLAGGTGVERILVSWPSGRSSAVEAPDIRRGTVTIIEPDASSR